MNIEVESFNEILEILDARGIEQIEATDEEIGDQANIIAQTVEPTKHGTPKK